MKRYDPLGYDLDEVAQEPKFIAFKKAILEKDGNLDLFPHLEEDWHSGYITLRCPIHGESRIRYDHVRNGGRCHLCAVENRRNNYGYGFKYWHDELVRYSKEINITIDQADLDRNINSNDVIHYKCNICGYESDIVVKSLLRGATCYACALIRRGKISAEQKRIPWDIRLEQIKYRNKDNEYTYPQLSDPEFKIYRAKDRIQIHCNVCGHDWETSFDDHVLRGTGCPICSLRYIGRGQGDRRYFSKVDKVISYMSKIEGDYLDWCNDSNEVIDFVYNPFKLSYPWFNTICKYIPDLLIYWSDRRISLVEIKYSSEVNYPINQAKFATAKEYCKSKGWKFEVWTEHDL